MRWLRLCCLIASRLCGGFALAVCFVLAMGYGFASCKCFLFCVWPMASRQVLGASCLIKFLLAYAVNLFWPMGLAYAF